MRDSKGGRDKGGSRPPTRPPSTDNRGDQVVISKEERLMLSALLADEDDAGGDGAGAASGGGGGGRRERRLGPSSDPAVREECEDPMTFLALSMMQVGGRRGWKGGGGDFSDVVEQFVLSGR